MRNMAFSLTTVQVRAGTKTVTRRIGWANLKPGEQFCAVEKGMGLKPGEKVVRLAVLRCVSNRPGPLASMTADPAYGKEEARKEGFPDLDGAGFVRFFCDKNPKVRPWDDVNRIEFEYVRFLP